MYINYSIILFPHLISSVKIEQDKTITPISIKLYLASIRSYFAYHDVDIIPSKFKRKVKLPKVYREDEEPL